MLFRSAEQHEHFEDLYLETDTITELQIFAIANAAEYTVTEVAWKNNRSIPLEKSPLRITKVDYWVIKHQDIDPEIWQHPEVNFKGDCQACHLDAEQGTFEDASMYLPE